jgi:hypothetical protein
MSSSLVARCQRVDCPNPNCAALGFGGIRLFRLTLTDLKAPKFENPSPQKSCPKVGGTDVPSVPASLIRTGTSSHQKIQHIQTSILLLCDDDKTANPHRHASRLTMMPLSLKWILLSWSCFLLPESRAWTSTTTVTTIGRSLPPSWRFPSALRMTTTLLTEDAPQLLLDTSSALQHTTNETQEAVVYLFSLQWTPDDCISKPVRDLWKWKDATLGDGRDFFVPKPKTIAALQDYIVRNAANYPSSSPNNKNNNLLECSVISNCARLEIVCVVPDNTNNPLDAIAHCLVAQMQVVPPTTKPLFQIWMPQSMMDWPDLVLDPNAPLIVRGEEDGEEDDDAARQIANHMTQIQGREAVLYHLSLVAAGMAARPRRPDRDTIFRPFSSRDAHVLLQLKRTKDIIAAATLASSSSSGNKRLLPQLLDYALRAGKAARNPQKGTTVGPVASLWDGRLEIFDPSAQGIDETSGKGE